MRHESALKLISQLVISIASVEAIGIETIGQKK